MSDDADKKKTESCSKEECCSTDSSCSSSDSCCSTGCDTGACCTPICDVHTAALISRSLLFFGLAWMSYTNQWWPNFMLVAAVCGAARYGLVGQCKKAIPAVLIPLVIYAAESWTNWIPDVQLPWVTVVYCV